MFKGSITALVSPFKGNNLDLEAFEKFINFQITNGTNGIVPVEQLVSRQQLVMMSTNY